MIPPRQFTAAYLNQLLQSNSPQIFSKPSVDLQPVIARLLMSFAQKLAPKRNGQKSIAAWNAQFSNGGAPSVDGEFCAVNETGTIRRQEDDSLGDLVRRSRAARRRLGG